MAQDTKAEFVENRIGTSNAPTFYANNVNVQVSPWDMRFRFSQIEDIDQNAHTITYRDVATVYLSPGQARAVFKILKEKMQKYEELWAQQPSIIDTLGKE